MCLRAHLWFGVVCLFMMLFAKPLYAADVEGSMRYNHASKQMEFYDGTRWYNFGIGLILGSCSQEGALDYEPLILTSYQYCNGSNWVKIVGIPTLVICTKAGAMEYNGTTFLVCNGLLWTNIKGFPASV